MESRNLEPYGQDLPSPAQLNRNCETKSLTGKTPKPVPPITDWLPALLDSPTQDNVNMLW